MTKAIDDTVTHRIAVMTTIIQDDIFTDLVTAVIKNEEN